MEKWKILEYVKKILVGREFVGDYVERSYVDRLKCYRDIIVVDQMETEFRAELRAMIEILELHAIWPSATLSNESGKNLLKLFVCFPLSKPSITFGRSSWRIATAELRKGELRITADRDPSSVILETKDVRKPTDFGSVLTAFTEFIRYVVLVLIVLIKAVTHILSLLAQLLYKCLDSLPKTIDSLMPLFLTIVNAVTKCVGGFYILIAMMWNGTPVKVHGTDRREYPQVEYRRPRYPKLSK